jgi:hypothetical protein
MVCGQMAPRSQLAIVSANDSDVVDLAAVRDARREPQGLPRYSPTTSLEKILRSAAPFAAQKLDWNEGTIAPPPSVAAAMVAHIQAATATSSSGTRSSRAARTCSTSWPTTAAWRSRTCSSPTARTTR